ncbi:signal transducer and activator of transcription 5A isoform X1 [Fukomys damarensis]|uniref:signal transducer and activator of transcription 5A isoform X1 n=1 Tax=Fukomys damarensis TaxID=885580 RepID=UPI001455DA31|nr:signal transducer and activator of transcription 5A isoform X1 [Fukomys damarensis]
MTAAPWSWSAASGTSCTASRGWSGRPPVTILGLVSRQRAHSPPNGTFLLRFSDSEMGILTIAWKSTPEWWVCVSPTPAHPAVDRTPWKGPQALHRDMGCLCVLPDWPKDKAFSRCYMPVLANAVDGYVKPQIK